MKKLLVAAVAAIALVGSAFAQISVATTATSNTNTATSGVFGNDTDDFMSVNNWSNVNPKNIFGFLGYGSDGLLNLGVAKKFGSLYFGAYLNGNLGLDFTDTTTKTKNSSTGSSSNSKTKTSSGKTSDFDISLLGGIGNNLGIKVFLSYTGDPTTISSSTTNTTDGSTTSYSSKSKHQEIIPGIEVGYNLQAGKLDLQNYASFFVDVKQDFTETRDITTTTTTNNNVVYVVLGGGSVIGLPQNDTVSQSVDANVYLTFGNKKASDNTKYSYFGINSTPTYSLTYDKIERLNIGLNFALPIVALFYSDTTTEGTTVTKNSDNSLSFKPELNLGLQYAAVPGKLTINAGASVASPSLVGTFVKANTKDSSSSDTTKTTTWKSTDGTGVLTLSTGFTYVLADAVTFDCNYNVLGDLLFGTLNSRWATGATTSVWNNVNLILFHSLNLQVSVKL